MTRTISGTPADGTPAADRLRRLLSTCPGCGLRFDPATARRNPAASENELATAIQAAEDVVDPRAVPTTCHQLDSWDVQFGPVDALNPGHGYSLRVERNGRLVTHTGKQGATGADLAGPEDCMRELAQILPRPAAAAFQPDPVPAGVMESIKAMGAEQDRRNEAATSASHCDICGRTGGRYRVPQNGHRRGQYLCDACCVKHAAPCEAVEVANPRDPAIQLDRAQEMDLPPAYLAISDEGDECIVKRFDSKAAADAYAREVAEQSGENINCVVMPTKVAFAAPAMLEACKAALTVHDVYSEPGRTRLTTDVAAKLRAVIVLAQGVPSDQVGTLLAIERDEARHAAAPKCQQKPISADSSFAGDAAARAAAVGHAMLERAMSRPRPDGPDAERFDEMTGPFPADDVAQSPERDRAQPHGPAADTPRNNGTAPERRGGEQNAAGTIAAPAGGKDAPDRSFTTAEAKTLLRLVKLTAAAHEANRAWIENRTGESDEEILRDRRLYRAKDAAEGALRDFVTANFEELRRIGGMA